jgi:glyoxylase-like metal-dependent hydrolase (beta-lactamase superfamily II)
MHELASGVIHIPLLPNAAINAYLADGMLIDAGVRQVAPLLLRRLRAHRPIAHLLTHAHPDHQGASHALCRALNLPLWCGAPDAAAMQSGRLDALLPVQWTNRLLSRLVGGPAHPVTRHLREGDKLGAWVVLETPGHTPGHISFWRPADRVLIVGDVLANQHPLTGRVGLIEPLRRFTLHPAWNRASARRLAALRPNLVCFGHGPPLCDPDALQRFADTI